MKTQQDYVEITVEDAWLTEAKYPKEREFAQKLDFYIDTAKRCGKISKVEYNHNLDRASTTIRLFPGNSFNVNDLPVLPSA